MPPIPHPPPIGGSGDPPLIPSAAYLVRNRHFTAPLAAFPAMAAAGFAAGAYGLHQDVLVGAGVADIAMWLAAKHKWDRPSEQWYARLSVLGGTGWLAAATWYGDSRWMLGSLACGCIAWGIPWWHHKRPRRTRREAAAVVAWDEWWQHYALDWGVPGSRVTDVTSKGPVETLTVQLWAGRQTHASVSGLLPLVESALRGYVGHGMVRAEPHPDDPSRVLLHLKRADPLAKVIDWHPSMTGTTICQPVIIGQGEGGTWTRQSLLTNMFIVGKSRWGKSNQLSLMLSTITGVPDARAWLIDMKGGRAARPWMKALDWVATDIPEARLMLSAALAEAKARATFADSVEEQLSPTPDVPAIFLIIDETHEVTSMRNGDSECANTLALLASQGMGLAVYVIVLTQYGALDESVRTEQTRSSLLLRMCFAVTQQSHGAFALSDYQRLDASKLGVKGTFYYQNGAEASSEKARAPELPHALVRRIAEQNGAMPKVPLRLFAADCQETYDMRWQRLPEVFRRHAPQWDGLAADPAPLPRQEAPVPATTPRDDDAFARAWAIEEELAGIPDVPLRSLRGVPDDFELRSEMEAQKARFARALTFAVPPGISPRQLRAASGMSRSWVMLQLKSLTEAGAIMKPEDGRYLASPGAGVWEAMEEIRAGSERLLAGSRSA